MTKSFRHWLWSLWLFCLFLEPLKFHSGKIKSWRQAGAEGKGVILTVFQSGGYREK